MTANHYHILGVAPGADDAAIRAAYRALMRDCHPDRNDDPHAQSRARDITAAFAVLRDPEKRAAYDAENFPNWIAIGEQAWPAADRRAAPPLRKLGLASVGVALALSLTLAVRPEWLPGPLPERAPAVAAKSKTARVAKQAAAPRIVAAHVPDTPRVSRTAIQPALPPPPAPAATPRQAKILAPVAAKVTRPEARMPPSATRQVAQAAPREKPAPVPVAAQRAADPKPAVMATTDDRRKQVERLATRFLKQSLEHADWHKQQLLLSAGNRSATSRTLCRSDDCVTEAYLRQIRDTTTIMEGRIPNP